MIVSVIAAVADNGVIGRDGGLPWHLPADLKRFKRLTTGHHMIMGRRTWDSIGRRPLPGRPTIVVSRDPEFVAGGAQVAGSVRAALELAAGADEVFIAGGGAVYLEALPVADRVYLTRVHGRFEGDAFFPPFDSSGWRVVVEERHEADEKNPHAHTFMVYERVRSQ